MQSKPIKVIEYLQSLAQINATTVRDCKDYQRLLWLEEVPQDRSHCFSRVRGGEEGVSDDVWLEIRKLQEPSLPAVPKACAPWVNEPTLRRLDDLPELHSTYQCLDEIIVYKETGAEEPAYKTLSLDDHPKVQEAWEHYLNAQWLPWSEAYQRYEAVQKIYATLFGIYQEQQRLGEQYELVLGLGLLNWRQPTGQNVHRHLIVAKASLEFESALGRFVVRAAPDGDQAEVEMDMLEHAFYPSNAESLLAEGRKLRDNIWDRATADSVLAAIANSLDEQGRGQYESASQMPAGNKATDTPLVEFAPALILRKRSLKGLLTLLATMRRQLEADAEVPRQFLELCEEENGDAPCVEGGSTSAPPPEHVFFPLPANEQQHQIIHKLNVQSGVLVQGPPGTGKSQTIANMICHLLATGQRVLVTAKAPRALEVLHEKIPDAVKPLCISLLGSGTDERESLERSVGGILNQVNDRDDRRARRLVEELEDRLQRKRAAKAEGEFALRALRERETFQHTVAGGAYCGTAAGIAARVCAEEGEFGWLTDQVIEADDVPLTPAEAEELAGLCESFDTCAEAEMAQIFPDAENDIAPSDQLREDWCRLASLGGAVKAGAARLAGFEGRALSSAPRDQVSVSIGIEI